MLLIAQEQCFVQKKQVAFGLNPDHIRFEHARQLRAVIDNSTANLCQFNDLVCSTLLDALALVASRPLDNRKVRHSQIPVEACSY